jgi:hypothetical protein
MAAHANESDFPVPVGLSTIIIGAILLREAQPTLFESSGLLEAEQEGAVSSHWRNDVRIADISSRWTWYGGE